MPNSDRKTVPEISNELEAAIQAGIANDPDNREITVAEFASMRPASELLPAALYAKLVTRGRPKAAVTKVPVKLRLDPPTVAAFKETGAGWQTRMNDVLASAAKALRGPKRPGVSMMSPMAMAMPTRAKAATAKAAAAKAAPKNIAAKAAAPVAPVKPAKASRPAKAEATAAKSGVAGKRGSHRSA